MTDSRDPPRLDEILGPVAAAFFTHNMVTLNGLQVLLIRLADKGVIDRQDIDLIAKGMGRAFNAPEARDNELTVDLHRKTDEIFAQIIAVLDKRDREQP